MNPDKQALLVCVDSLLQSMRKVPNTPTPDLLDRLDTWILETIPTMMEMRDLIHRIKSQGPSSP